ncbi:MAG TPA: vitamin B12-dependent ribonucleotide reductase [Erysipelotrichaceae bacterium]|nr:vitamin B12-dependent ribonucleotide reductase [Erysipelotrichaceae bacterium]
MYKQSTIKQLNKDIIEHYPHLFPIEPEYKTTNSGVGRLVMLDRYAQKDLSLKTLQVNDTVLTIIKNDPKYPARGIGHVIEIDEKEETVTILIEKEFRATLEDKQESETGVVIRHFKDIDKPLELYFEQIAKRVGTALAQEESTQELRDHYSQRFFEEISALNSIPAGRVLYGAGSNSDVTYFNCFVMPFIEDSRGGIAEHRKEVMEIMSRGGGVGTNGSTLRPKSSPAKSVGGKSSGAVSWLNDIANLTHLVEQGGSRRGAQMIMMADWHPDIIEFIISKMQNPKVLKWLSENSNDEVVRAEALKKLKFTPLSPNDIKIYDALVNSDDVDEAIKEYASDRLLDGGTLEVNDEEFLSGANISVTLTKEFMDAVENDTTFDLRYPDLENYTVEEKAYYDKHWHEVGDVREWQELGYAIKVHRTVRARDIWDLISFCATYSAEPGIFFIDNANDMTNAKAYGQKVVATNPCGEQPLAPYSVCNLAAINLANFANKETGEILYDKLDKSVRTQVRLQDNVIDSTPYFLEANKDQALGERRIGLGIMGLHDLLIWAKVRYGSPESIDIINKVFETIAESAYAESVEIAKVKGSFPFLTDNKKFTQTGFMQHLSQGLRDDIEKYGIRNSHLLTIAPTGSTGTMVGVSTGLEPYFSFSYFRSGRLGKFIEVNADIVEEWLKYNPDYSSDNLPDFFVSAMDLKPEEHADVQTTIQYWIDSSISKTVNAPRGFTVKDVQSIYERLYKNGAKGGTVYVDGSRDSQVLSLTTDDNSSDWDQLDLVKDFGASVREVQEGDKLTDLRADRLDREIGIEVGNICPICLEGQVENLGGCNTCTNCNAQLKCDI